MILFLFFFIDTILFIYFFRLFFLGEISYTATLVNPR